MKRLLSGHVGWGIPLLVFFIGTQASWAESGSKAKWEETVAAVHKEGCVSIYGQARSPWGAAIRLFEKAYPKIRLDFTGGRGGQLGPRIMAEKRANKHLVAIAIAGSGTQVQVYYRVGHLEPINSAFILAEVQYVSLWWQKRHHYADSEKRYFAMLGDVSVLMGAYNPHLVRPGEVRSWWDMLDPKWKGEIVMTDPKARGDVGNWRFSYYSSDLEPRFIKRFIEETDVRFSVDERQMMDWLGSGKYPIHIMAKIKNTEKTMKQGLPVRPLYSQKEADAMSTRSGHISVFKNVPHPNAARVYINWTLSREGQLA
jgi:iron(III) transport system substrate-binding protein